MPRVIPGIQVAPIVRRACRVLKHAATLGNRGGVVHDVGARVRPWQSHVDWLVTQDADDLAAVGLA